MTADLRDQWLQRLVGDWTFESEMSPTPGAPAGKYRGRERVRSLGDAGVVCETEWHIPDGETQLSRMTLGWDTEKGGYTPVSLDVLTLDGAEATEVTAFVTPFIMPHILPKYTDSRNVGSMKARA